MKTSVRKYNSQSEGYTPETQKDINRVEALLARIDGTKEETMTQIQKPCPICGSEKLNATVSEMRTLLQNFCVIYDWKLQAKSDNDLTLSNRALISEEVMVNRAKELLAQIDGTKEETMTLHVQRNDELKPCPLCGGTKINLLNQDGKIIIECADCGLRTCEHSDQQAAVKLWNDRRNDQPATNARLRQILMGYSKSIYAYSEKENTSGNVRTATNLKIIAYQIEQAVKDFLGGDEE